MNDVKLQPSSFPMLLECPCFVPAPRPHVTTPGTDEHTMLECLVYGKEVPADADRLTDDQREDVLWAKEELFRIFAEHNVSPAEVKSELYVTIMDADFSQVTRGRVDYGFGRVVIDYKSGFPRNATAQLDAYACGWAQERGLESVVTYEVYGRARRTRKRIVSREFAEGTVFDIVAAVLSPNKKPKSCSYCGWCAKTITCPALLVPMMLVFDSIDSVEMDQNSKDAAIIAAAETKPGEATAEQLGNMMVITEVLSPWVDAVKERVKAELVSGAAIPGFAFHRVKGNRYIEDNSKALQLTGVQVEDFLGCCKVALGKLESLFCEHVGGKKTDAKKQLESILSGIVKREKDRILVDRIS